MDAYRYIVSHPIRTSTEAGYNTSYQRQRTEAWKQTTAKPANSNVTLLLFLSFCELNRFEKKGFY